MTPDEREPAQRLYEAAAGAMHWLYTWEELTPAVRSAWRQVAGQLCPAPAPAEQQACRHTWDCAACRHNHAVFFCCHCLEVREVSLHG